jgi:hypothetical protein
MRALLLTGQEAVDVAHKLRGLEEIVLIELLG